MAANKPSKQPAKSGGPKQLIRMGLFWAIVIFLGLGIYAAVMPGNTLKEVPLSDVINRANKGQIAVLEIQGNDITVTPKDSSLPGYEIQPTEGARTRPTQREGAESSSGPRVWNVLKF